MLKCLKCGSSATRVEIENDKTAYLVCKCGKRELLYSSLDEGIQVEHLNLIEGKVTLPKKGTKMMACLASVADMPGGETGKLMTLLEVRGTHTWTMDEVVANLNHLYSRGLVTKTKKGGDSRSTVRCWSLTTEAKVLLRV